MPRERAHSGRRRHRSSRRRDTAPDHGSDARPVARGVWSGSITFGLVTVPVELYAATRPTGVALRMLGPDGTPLARRYVCSRDGKTLEDDEIVRGYEIADGRFVVVGDEELERLAPRRSRDIELTRFVDRDAIDPAYFVRPYFVVPDADQSKAYRLLAETMESTGRAALASFVMRGKAYAVALFADGGVLRAETLRFGDELRSPQAIGLAKSPKVDASLGRRFARAIAKRKESRLDERELADPESSRLLDLARAKWRKKQDVVNVPEPPEAEQAAEETVGGEGAEVIDLFALIQQRLRGSSRQGPRRAAKRPAAKSHRTAGPRRVRAPKR